MSALFAPPVDVVPAMYVGDECREGAHSATKRLGMARRERSCLHRLDNKGTWTSTLSRDDFEACSLHSLLKSFGAAGESANAVLLRLTSEERARLCAIGACLTGEHATPSAKRARLG